MYDISRLLRDNPYPGRGIVLGRRCGAARILARERIVKRAEITQ